MIAGENNNNNLPPSVNKSAYNEALLLAAESIKKQGFYHIHDFIHSEFVSKMKNEADSLRDAGFRSDEPNNIYLESIRHENDCHSKHHDHDVSSCSFDVTSNEQQLESSFPTTSINGHHQDIPIREKIFTSSKTLVNMKQLPHNSSLLELYRSDCLRILLQKAFDLKKLYPSADPVGGVYYNFFENGDELGWHFDRSQYSVNLILQEPENGMGGEFTYWPDSRNEVDTWEYWQEPQEAKLIIPQLLPGSLYLFAGNRSLHCVSKVKEGNRKVRTNAIFTYNEKPNMMLNYYTRKMFFGVD